MNKFFAALPALAAAACAATAHAQVKWDLPTGYSANSFQTQPEI